MTNQLPALCGVWVDDDGRAHVSMASVAGGREERIAPLRLFAWLREPPADGAVAGIQVERLKGEGAFPWLAQADSPAAYDAILKLVAGADAIRPHESQFLLQTRARLFSEISFAQLRRCQLDIETASGDGHFSNAARPEDRVLAIGLRFGAHDRTLVLDELTDAAEKKLLADLNTVLAAEDPDVIEGHNIFKFDLDYLRQRCRRHQVPCAWGRFGQPASFRNSRLKVAERLIDFPRCDLPGRAVVDTYLLVLL